MKLTKRIIALVVVLCTVGAMMIPGVSVTAAVGDTTTYSIYSTTAAPFSTSSGTYWIHNSSYDNWTTMEGYYKADTINWKIEAHSISSARIRTSYMTINHNYKYDTQLRFFALRVKSPGAGTYSLNVRHRAEAAGLDTVKAYVFAAPEEAFTSYGSSSDVGTLQSYMATYVTENDAQLEFSAVAETATVTTEEGTSKFTLGEGEECMVVFSLQNVNTDATTGNAIFNLMDIYLVEQETEAEPGATYDYSVIYDANYPDAEAIPADSLTSAEASVEFTAKTLERDGYTFEGWATSASGSVAYAAGATITLYSDAPSLNLYAVWTENNIEHKTDNLTVNFFDDFNDAELAASTYHQAIGTTFDAAYTNHTNEWTTYLAQGYAGGGRFRYNSGKTNGVLEVITNNGKGFIALKFRAPGTGWYKLAVDYTWLSAGDVDADLAGAYILPLPSAGYTAATLPDRTTVNNAAEITVLTQGTYEGKDLVELTTGKEYLIVFYAESAARSYTNFSGFSLTYVGAEKPYAAEVDGVKYSDFAEALAALETATNKTVKLGKDVEINELNLDDGMILDLNGKTLTVTGAVDAEIKDTTDGDGILVAAQDAIITSPAGTIALWDNNASGYRVFNYELTNYAVSAGQDNITGVDQKINFYSYAEENLPEDIETENWNALKITTDTDNLANIKADYVAEKINWRYEYASYVGQFATGKGNTLNSGDSSISFTMIKNSWVAIRFRSPNDTGKMAVTLKTGNKASGGAIFDGYILKASDVYTGIDATTLAGYADNVAADPDVKIDAMYTAINNAITGAEPVFTNCEVATTGGNTYSESYNFEASTEYILVMKVQNAGASTQYVRITDLNITRQEKNGATQTFWSTLTFNKDYAYTLVSSGLSGLKFGFDMDLNGNQKTFDFSSVLADWADAELEDTTAKTKALYVRVSGFEKLEETSTLTGRSYISSDKWEAPVYAEGSLTYTHTIN